jgi:hypothetical protein
MIELIRRDEKNIEVKQSNQLASLSLLSLSGGYLSPLTLSYSEITWLWYNRLSTAANTSGYVRQGGNRGNASLGC